MRQASAGHWEALITGVWYPRSWLRHDATNSQPAHAEQATERAPEGCALSLPEAPETAVEREFYLPPPPENFPEGWDNGGAVAADFFAKMIDGRGRNIYAGLVRGEALKVEVPAGEYLTAAVLPYDKLPRYAALNANTGLGKTSYALDIPGQKIIATSSTLALEQILERSPGAHAFYRGRKDAQPDSQLIVTTYESFKRLLPKIDASRFTLVIDEAHNFAASSSKAFRGNALEAVMDTLNGAWQSVVLMTGTPVPLCHPYLEKFTQVNVSSEIRTQRAQRVVYKDKAGKGKRLDSVLELCNPEQKHLIFLNSKGTQLDSLRAGLRARGYKDAQIAILNSDTKNEGNGRAIVEQERLPEGVRVLIVTAVAMEALNLRDTFDCVHLVSPTHPYLAQQLVNRQRAAAAGIVYWYNVGSGEGYLIDTHKAQAHVLDEARSMAEGLNRLARVNPNDNSQEAILARSSMYRFQTAAGALVRIDEDVEDGRKWWDISYLGVDNETFQNVATYTERNPQAWKNELARYGWAWLEDKQPAIAKVDKATAARQKAFAAEMRKERELAHQAHVATIREHGEAWTRDAARQHEDVQVLQTAQQIVRIMDDIRPCDSEQQAAFLKACELVEGANNSTRTLNRIRRQIKAQHLANSGDAFTLALMGTFTPGEKLTSEEVHQRVTAVYAKDEVMELHARRVLPYYFSKKPESRLTARKAVEVLGDLYEVKRSSERLPGNAEPIHVYVVVGKHEAAEIVATLGERSNKQTKVATKAPALAFETSERIPAEISDAAAGALVGKVLAGTATREELATYQAWKLTKVYA
jgi:hypothetical protein